MHLTMQIMVRVRVPPALPMRYPAYFNLNRAQSGYDRTNNLQVFGIYHLPFGASQTFLTHGVAGAIFGGFQLTGQLSHISGAPFTVSPSSSAHQRAGCNGVCTARRSVPSAWRPRLARQATSAISGGKPWFDPTSFANPVEPQYTNPGAPGYVNCSVPSCIVSPNFGNTRRNQFRGPGVTNVNASVTRSFKIWRESEFQVRVEAFNLLNHAELVSNPNVTVGGGTFGYITSFALGNNANPTRTVPVQRPLQLLTALQPTWAPHVKAAEPMFFALQVARLRSDFVSHEILCLT